VRPTQLFTSILHIKGCRIDIIEQRFYKSEVLFSVYKMRPKISTFEKRILKQYIFSSNSQEEVHYEQ